MGIVVQKYGGTSVGTIERIQAVAKRVAETRAAGHQLVVVVSAIAGETNRLIGLGQAMSKTPADREMDVLVASGEQVSSALLSLALNEIGVPAASLLAHQVRILTDTKHARARIQSIDATRMRELLDAGTVAVIAGFQGVDKDGNITTLGRGGTDTTAVAVAAALNADVCEIFTDVDGVYTTDPNVCSSARKVPRISYEEMLELASLGAKVLQIRSVELGMKFGVPIHVRSSFSAVEGTMVVKEEEALESVVVSGVACNKREAKVTIQGVPDHPGAVAAIFEPLADSNISVDMIIQNVSKEGTTDITFTVNGEDLVAAERVATEVSKAGGAGGVLVDDGIAKISVVGLGMRSHAGVAAKMFRLLAAEGINIEAISTSEIKVSCLIRERYSELAVRVLHEGFELGKKPSTLPPGLA